MNDIRVKVAYLQGLAEGLDLNTESPEGRLLSSVIEVLGDLADQVVHVVESHGELAEYIEDVDYDLGALEEAIYSGTVDPEDVAEDDMDEYEAIEADQDDDEAEIALLTCPSCGEALAAGAGDLDADMRIVCPTCGCLCVTGEIEFDEDLMMEHD